MDYDFTQKILQLFSTFGKEIELQKGDFLTREGDVENKLYLIQSGAIRVYYLSDFEEQTVRLGYNGSIMNSLSSFISGKPSEFYIEAIRKTRLTSLTKDQLLTLIHENQSNLQMYVKLLETLITQQIDREIDLLISSPTERFNRVLKRSPTVFQHVPLKYIASYLRMKPETLSRIRNS